MFNEYRQACNYAKLLKPVVTTPCLPAFLQQVFSTLHWCPFIISVTFCWMLSNMFMSVALWSPEMGTVPSVSCAASPSSEWSRRITTLAGSALQLRVPLCPQGHIAGSCSVWCPLRLPDTFLPSCFSDSCPHFLHIRVPGFVLSQVQHFAISMVEFQDVPISPFL